MKPYVLALDLGGTNSVLGVVDETGKIVCTDSFRTQSFSVLEDYVEQCALVAERLFEQVGGKDQIEAFGIGAPDVNYWGQTIENATNLPWKGIVPLAAKLEARLGIRVRMTNDAKAAALGEMLYGAAKGMKDFIMLTLGTGVGSGIVVNGENEGLTMAEVELESADESYEKLDFIGEEVTGDVRYYNSFLMKNPFTSW